MRSKHLAREAAEGPRPQHLNRHRKEHGEEAPVVRPACASASSHTTRYKKHPDFHVPDPAGAALTATVPERSLRNPGR